MKGLSPINVGSIEIQRPLFLAPMAGVSDYPFREIARRNGAGICISEMVTSQTDLWHTKKSAFRLPSEKDPEPRPVQIAGAEPDMMAEAARRLADMGAGIIDINMGCPMKKVCAKAAGSALLANESRVASILTAVVSAVDVPVTLKTRTGTDPENKNVIQIGQMAQDIGIQAITVHGRTRACRFKGQAEYGTIKQLVDTVSIPVIANGDIDSPEKAKKVLEVTNAQGLMIGRGAWGKPWLFQQISDYLQKGTYSVPSARDVGTTAMEHVRLLHETLDEVSSVRFVRKHVDKYLEPLDSNKVFRRQFNRLNSAESQQSALNNFFSSHKHPSTEAA